MAVRNSQPDQLPAFDTLDRVPQNWETFLSSLPAQSAVSGNNLQTVVTDDGIALLSFSPRLDVIFSISISRKLKVKAKRSSTLVSVRNILGFQHTLERWSQLEAIINRVKQATPSLRSECQDLISRIRANCADQTTEFLLQQLELSQTSPHARHYSPQMFLHALRLYIASKSGYRQLRKLLALPHPKTLKLNIGPLHLTGGVAECKHMVESILSSLSPAQRNCSIIFDEVYIKPSLRYRGAHVIGRAVDQPGTRATTVLAILVKPLLGGPAFIARLIPVRSLNKEFLYNQLDTVVDIVHDCGGTVRSFVCDNHFVNKQVYKMMSKGEERPFIGRTSHQTGIHLLYDSTHLLKNVRNNWLSEALQQLKIQDPVSEQQWTAKFSDVRSMYATECDQTVRMTKLSYTACYPTSLERQNFQHVAAVFNEKTVAALTLNGKIGTAKVVELFTNMWNILNVKNTSSHIHLNDPNRRPITSVDDENLIKLQSFAESIRKMPGGKGPGRKCSLTSETRNALVQTIDGLVSLSKELLGTGEWKYVLLGMFQSDELEGEFGVYRQMCGGCYHIALDQVLCTARFRKLNILSGIRAPLSSSHHADCCTTPLSSIELTACDECHSLASKLSQNVKGSLYFICGYVAKKEKLLHKDSFTSAAHGEFTRLVSRGKLRYPPDWLFDYACLCFSVFENIPDPSCCTRIVRLFCLIFDSYFVQFTCQPSSIARRLAQCFFKGLVRKTNSPATPCGGENSRRLKKLAP
jgi:hypothetical protein